MPANIKITWLTLEEHCFELAKIIGPCDVIVAIGRGGLVPGVLLSNHLDCPIYNFGIKSYKKDNTQGDITVTQIPGIRFNSDFRDKRVIIFDDLSDKGETLREAKNYFEDGQFTNFKFATLYIKSSTKFIPNFYVKSFDENLWLDFPWEACKLD
jgi:hypoxanthine phosphoribosyltransferase